MAKKVWVNDTTTKINKEEVSSISTESRQAAHAMIYSESSKLLFGHVPMKYNILIGMRFDGFFGFPGGFIDNTFSTESIVDGLNRELMEEINLDSKLAFTEDNYLSSYVQVVSQRQKLINHFYVKKISEKEFLEMEHRCLNAVDWGKETLGIVRVPVHDRAGFNKNTPIVNFLGNNFVGNARQELVEGLIHCDIFTENQMLETWKCLPKSHR